MIKNKRKGLAQLEAAGQIISSERLLTGFTLTELIIGLAISAVLVLIIGAISSSSNSSYDRLRKEAQVYNDIYYGLDLIKHSVRNSGSLNLDEANDILQAGDLTFKQEGNNFVYYLSGNITANTVLKEVDNLDFEVSSAGNRLIVVVLSGEKDRAVFSITAKVDRRN